MITRQIDVDTTGRADGEIVLTRVFDAPRERVLDALTNPDLLERWMDGPDQWPLTVCEIELKVGGAVIYLWRRTDAADTVSRGVRREIVPPGRIVHSQLFDDSLATTAIVEKGGRTTVTSTVAYSTRAACDVALETILQQGLGRCYDRLADLVAEMIE